MFSLGGSYAKSLLLVGGPLSLQAFATYGRDLAKRTDDGVSPHVDRFGPSLHVSPTLERALVLAIPAT